MRYQPQSFVADKPMSEINTTPMIDVMLVLLIMMMLSLPMRTHKLPIELPSTAAVAGKSPVIHRLSLDSVGSPSWDGVAITPASLDKKLVEMVSDPAKPVLQMQTDAATPYVRFDETLGAVRRAGIEQIGFVGNEAFLAL